MLTLPFLLPFWSARYLLAYKAGEDDPDAGLDLVDDLNVCRGLVFDLRQEMEALHTLIAHSELLLYPAIENSGVLNAIQKSFCTDVLNFRGQLCHPDAGQFALARALAVLRRDMQKMREEVPDGSPMSREIDAGLRGDHASIIALFGTLLNQTARA